MIPEELASIARAYDCVVPAFKEEAYIGGLLGALGRQTLKPHCVIVALYSPAVSTDRTGEIARNAGARVVDVDGPGIGYARAVGCRHADAPYILNIDADCEPKPDFAEKLLEPIEKEGCVATFGFGNWGEEEASFLERVANGLIQGAKYFIPAGQCFGGLMVRRDAYEDVGGFMHMQSLEDMDLSARLATAYPLRVRYVPEAFTYSSARRLEAAKKDLSAQVDYSKAYRAGEEVDVG